MSQPFDLEVAVLALSEEEAEWALSLDSQNFYAFLGHPEFAERSTA